MILHNKFYPGDAAAFYIVVYTTISLFQNLEKKVCRIPALLKLTLKARFQNSERFPISRFQKV